MKRQLGAIALAMGLGVAVAACGSGGSTVSSSTGAASTSSTVTIADFSFAPSTMQVKAGTTVTFRNTGMQAHTATSDMSSGFDAGTVQPGTTKDVTLTTPGTITYHCSFHPIMKATIVVS